MDSLFCEPEWRRRAQATQLELERARLEVRQATIQERLAKIDRLLEIITD